MVSQRRLTEHDLAKFVKNPNVSILGAGAVVREFQQPAKKPVAVVVEVDRFLGVYRGGKVGLVQFLSIRVQVGEYAIVAGLAHIPDGQITPNVGHWSACAESLGLTGRIAVPAGDDMFPRLFAQHVAVGTVQHKTPIYSSGGHGGHRDPLLGQTPVAVGSLLYGNGYLILELTIQLLPQLFQAICGVADLQR